MGRLPLLMVYHRRRQSHRRHRSIRRRPVVVLSPFQRFMSMIGFGSPIVTPPRRRQRPHTRRRRVL